MTEAVFPTAIAAALDRYSVPALPQGFADRLIERAQLRADIAALPATRRSSSGPWRRTGRVIASVAAIGLFTAAAAAGGIFGKPVYVPGITEAMQQANIIKRTPVATAHSAKPQRIAAPDPAIAPATGEAKAKAAIDTLRADPQYQQLRPRQKVRAVLKETRTLVKSGEITREEGRAAIRETVKESYDQMSPQQQQAAKQQIKQARERRTDRRALRRERLQAQQDASEIPAP